MIKLAGLGRIFRGFGYLTLDPSRLRRLRRQAEADLRVRARRGEPLPPVPDSAYGPDAVPLDLSGVPEGYRWEGQR